MENQVCTKLIDGPPSGASVEAMKAFIAKVKGQYPDTQHPDVLLVIQRVENRIQEAKAEGRDFG